MNIKDIVGHATEDEAADLMRECFVALPEETAMKVVTEMLTKAQIEDIAISVGIVTV